METPKTSKKEDEVAIIDVVISEQNKESQQGTSTLTSDEQQSQHEHHEPPEKSEDTNDEMMIDADAIGTDTDIGKWPDHLSKSVVDYWIKKGSKDLQHCDEKLIDQKSYQ